MAHTRVVLHISVANHRAGALLYLFYFYISSTEEKEGADHKFNDYCFLNCRMEYLVLLSDS